MRCPCARTTTAGTRRSATGRRTTAARRSSGATTSGCTGCRPTGWSATRRTVTSCSRRSGTSTAEPALQHRGRHYSPGMSLGEHAAEDVEASAAPPTEPWSGWMWTRLAVLAVVLGLGVVALTAGARPSSLARLELDLRSGQVHAVTIRGEDLPPGATGCGGQR